MDLLLLACCFRACWDMVLCCRSMHGGGGGGRRVHLDVLVGKQLLHLGAVRTRHASVVDGKAVGQDVAQVGALAALCLLLKDCPAGRVHLQATARVTSSPNAASCAQCMLRTRARLAVLVCVPSHLEGGWGLQEA